MPHGALIIGGIGFMEILLIALIIILLFGARKLPELARGIGEAIKEFRKASSAVEQPAQPSVQEPQGAKETLLGAARRLGISTEGKTAEQIFEEIVKAAEKSKKV